MNQSRNLNKQSKKLYFLSKQIVRTFWLEQQKPTKSDFSKGDAVVGSCEQGIQGMKNLAFRHDWILCLTSVIKLCLLSI